MKVLVVGANGKVAKCFADLTKDYSDIEEKAVIRDASQKTFLMNVVLKLKFWILFTTLLKILPKR
ncbi:hypothetical protein GCM10025853_19990 [Tetragenococcus halophilus subsp. halophilus DSM 20339]|nr:hypothetical protein GCM10025853_19990 [Tetragenococcus halophilus subsp. halophilus DSM 20339]